MAPPRIPQAPLVAATPSIPQVQTGRGVPVAKPADMAPKPTMSGQDTPDPKLNIAAKAVGGDFGSRKTMVATSPVPQLERITPFDTPRDKIRKGLVWLSPGQHPLEREQDTVNKWDTRIGDMPISFAVIEQSSPGKTVNQREPLILPVQAMNVHLNNKEGPKEGSLVFPLHYVDPIIFSPGALVKCAVYAGYIHPSESDRYAPGNVNFDVINQHLQQRFFGLIDQPEVNYTPEGASMSCRLVDFMAQLYEIPVSETFPKNATVENVLKLMDIKIRQYGATLYVDTHNANGQKINNILMGRPVYKKKTTSTKDPKTGKVKTTTVKDPVTRATIQEYQHHYLNVNNASYMELLHEIAFVCGMTIAVYGDKIHIGSPPTSALRWKFTMGRNINGLTYRHGAAGGSGRNKSHLYIELTGDILGAKEKVTRQTRDANGKSKTVPVYEADGKTQKTVRGRKPWVVLLPENKISDYHGLEDTYVLRIRLRNPVESAQVDQIKNMAESYINRVLANMNTATITVPFANPFLYPNDYARLETADDIQPGYNLKWLNGTNFRIMAINETFSGDQGYAQTIELEGDVFGVAAQGILKDIPDGWLLLPSSSKPTNFNQPGLLVGN